MSHWVEYFCQGMADSFAKVRKQAERQKPQPDQTKLLRELDTRQKRKLEIFKDSRYLTTREVAEHLGVSTRTALTYVMVGWKVVLWSKKGSLNPEGMSWLNAGLSCFEFSFLFLLTLQVINI